MHAHNNHHYLAEQFCTPTLQVYVALWFKEDSSLSAIPFKSYCKVNWSSRTLMVIRAVIKTLLVVLN